MHVRYFSKTALLFATVVFCARGNPSQQAAPAAPLPGQVMPAAREAVAAISEVNRYRIGPGDVLDIRVSLPMPDAPQLSRDTVRVDGNGMIRMPRIEAEIQAACKTEGELSREIATRYQKFYLHPSVDVFVKEFNSKQVAVVGAVNQPSRFQLQRRVRLLELLVYANGPAERAGQVINVIHAGGPDMCQSRGGLADNDITPGLVSYKLSQTLRGDEEANPYLRAGDIVSVPTADQVFVVGNVVSPRAIPLTEPVTVTRAIAMAGGARDDSKTDRVRLVRQAPGRSTKTEMYVDLKAINKRRAEDIALLPNDILDVPTSAGKSLLRSLLGTVAPALEQLPVRIIP